MTAGAAPSCPFDRLESPHLENPYPLYAEARARGPVFYDPVFEFWVVTAYDEVVSILRQPGRFSSRDSVRTPTPLPPDVVDILAEGYPECRMLVDDDPPSHTRMRTLVGKAFSPQRVRSLEPEIVATADELIDGFVGDGRADLVSQFAYPYPMRVIAGQMGVPRADHDLIKRWSDDWVVLISGNLSGPELRESARGFVSFQHYFDEVVEDRRRNPLSDLPSALVAARSDGLEPLTTPEIVSLLMVMMFAGHETTTNLIGNAVLWLLTHPAQWDAIRSHPTLVGAAVEETFRFDSAIQGMMRTTTEPVRIGGVAIPAGERIFVCYGAANRDPERFASPDTFDIRRAVDAPHLGLGLGIHFCIGAALARLEVQVALRLLAARLPGLRRDDDGPVSYLPNLVHRGPRRLGVQWDRS